MGSIGSDREASQEFTPDLYPAFPKAIKACVELETFSLAKLQSANSAEHARLYEVCKARGFFYLEMNETYAESLPQDAEAIGHLSEDVFKLSTEEKMKYGYIKERKDIFGYKQAGIGRVDKRGSLDTCEFFNCSKDAILENSGRTPVDLPPILKKPASRSLLGRYQKNCHKVGVELLNILGTQLGVAADTFDNLHRITQPSGDHVRMTRGPPRKSPDLSLPEIQVPGHTDFGSITILFNWLGGLQVWSEPSRGSFQNVVDPDAGTADTNRPGWLWVKPKPGHAIVNLGDAAVKFSGGILCSGRHRVVPAPGEQGLWPRYSVVYFVRPEDKIILQRLQGKEIPPLGNGEEEEEVTAAQWIINQANFLRASSAKVTEK